MVLRVNQGHRVIEQTERISYNKNVEMLSEEMKEAYDRHYGWSECTVKNFGPLK